MDAPQAPHGDGAIVMLSFHLERLAFSSADLKLEARHCFR
jgi:hypothetical protein